MPEGVEQRDFFISFNSADLAYAEAIDAALRADGFSTFYHPRDLPPGGNIPMDVALMNSAQTLALYSPAYTSDKAIYSKAERYATWWQDPGGDKRKLIPVLLRETTFTPLMAMISRVEVLGMTPDEAAAHVLQRLKRPEEAEPRDVWRRGLPLPSIFNVGYRPNPNFTGRFEALESLQQSLRAGSNAAITAVAGMGGIGKTTLAAEYCHRFGGRYAGVWWVRAEQEMTMLADLAALGQRLGLPPSGSVEKDARAVLEQLGCVTEPWLMVHDNAPNPDAVRQWLPVGAVRCIITSRFTEFGDLAPVTRVDQWPDAVTAEYLLARTERNDADGAARLAKILGGLPLAAEQAASFLRTRNGISFDKYANDIAQLIKRRKDAGITGDYPDTVYAAFVKSLETLQGMLGGEIGLDLLRLCSFLSPDGVDLALVAIEGGHEVLPARLARAMTDPLAREDALAALTSLSLLRREGGPTGTVLIFHRLLLEVVRDWIGDDARSFWGTTAARLVSGVFPGGAVHSEPSNWPLCSRLILHITPLDAYAPKTGEAERALSYLLNQAVLYLIARGDRAGVLTLAEKTVALLRVKHLDDRLALAFALNNLAGCYVDLDRFDEAEVAYREALEIEEACLDQGDPNLAGTISNLAGIHRRRGEFPTAEAMYIRAAEIIKAALGSTSAEYGRAMSNLGLLYGQWWEISADKALQTKAANNMTKALATTRIARGARHPETAIRNANLAGLNARMGDWQNAAKETKQNLAIKLSLGLLEHPQTKSAKAELIHIWEQSGHADKAARLRAGDISDLVPVIAQIELEHRAWVAEDPENRHFGPDSSFVASMDALVKSLQTLAAAGVDMDAVIRCIKAGELSLDDFAKLVTEAIGNKKG